MEQQRGKPFNLIKTDLPPSGIWLILMKIKPGHSEDAQESGCPPNTEMLSSRQQLSGVLIF